MIKEKAIVSTPSPSYKLPDADRQAILQKSPFSIRAQKIEKQRQQYVLAHQGQDGTGNAPLPKI